MRILAFGDTMGRSRLVASLPAASILDSNLLVFTGDIPNPEVFKILREQQVLAGATTTQRVKSEIETSERLAGIRREIELVLLEFERLRAMRPLVGVLGNADLQKLLRMLPPTPAMTPLHCIVLTLMGWHLVGYNGRPLYTFEDINEDENAFSEEHIHSQLEATLKDLDPERVILVTHAPPYGILDRVSEEYRSYAVATYGSRAADGRIGSTGLREVVETFGPRLHLFGHIHECRGVCATPRTTFVNAGSLGADGCAARIDITSDVLEVVFETCPAS